MVMLTKLIARPKGLPIWSPQAEGNKKMTSTSMMGAVAAILKGHQIAPSNVDGLRAARNVGQFMEVSQGGSVLHLGRIPSPGNVGR